MGYSPGGAESQRHNLATNTLTFPSFQRRFRPRRPISESWAQRERDLSHQPITLVLGGAHVICYRLHLHVALLPNECVSFAQAGPYIVFSYSS